MSNEIFQGSNNVQLLFVVSNASGALNLTDATVTLLISLQNTKAEKLCTVDDATAGECSVMLESGDLVSIGRYRHQLKIEYGSGDLYYTNIQFFDTLKILEEVV